MTSTRSGYKTGRARAASAATTGGYHLFSGILAAVFLIPILWAVLNSLKSPAEANQNY